MKSTAASPTHLPPPPASAFTPTEADIQKEAYYLWIENGRPAGRDVEFWHAAAEILRHRAAREHALAAPFAVHFPPPPPSGFASHLVTVAKPRA
jgi:hypothetical protein